MTEKPGNRVGLIGWPVEHSVSPSMHNAAFRELGLDIEYKLLPTPPGKVQARLGALEGDGYRGANVTVPHKYAVMPYLHSVAQSAQAMGAVNTIVVQEGHLRGFNTDGDGFLAALREAAFEPADRQALVLGAGGSARAVVYSLAQAGCPVTIYNRSAERAAALVQHLTDAGVGQPLTALPTRAHLEDLDFSRFGLLVNATPLGMWPETNASPWPDTLRLPSHLTIFDLVYNPEQTQLMAEARAAGAKVIGGLAMLVHQGARAFELWTGQEAPVDVMRTAAEQALGLGSPSSRS
jgi:shikimate dehydrogenase